MCNRKWWWSIFIWVLEGSVRNAYLIYREILSCSKIKKIYWVPNKMSHLQFLEYLSTHVTTFKKRKSKQLRNTSEVAAESGKKR